MIGPIIPRTGPNLVHFRVVADRRLPLPCREGWQSGQMRGS